MKEYSEYEHSSPNHPTGKDIEYRKLQKFSSPADIMNIKGIGEKKFEKMKQYLSVGKK